jgi:predicted DNA-binding protein with PD1-like motif
LRTVPLRLSPGCDLRQEIERAASDLPGQCGFVLCGIGSLSRASLRFADVASPTVFVEPLEVLSLSGSVTPEGAHLHAAVATGSGQVLGGHVAYGCVVRTTAEVLVAALPDWRLWREHDPATGYMELNVAQRPTGDGR